MLEFCNNSELLRLLQRLGDLLPPLDVFPDGLDGGLQSLDPALDVGVLGLDQGQVVLQDSDVVRVRAEQLPRRDGLFTFC